jgi:hypothetical protein
LNANDNNISDFAHVDSARAEKVLTQLKTVLVANEEDEDSVARFLALIV